MPESAIVDTSALIALDKLHLQEMLCKLYSEIILPQAVIDEFGSPGLPCFSVRQTNSYLINLLTRELSLGKGDIMTKDARKNFFAG